jgi:hypothetical protein
MEFTTLTQLLLNPPDPIPSLWGGDAGLLPCRGLTLLHAGSKQGKSMLTLNLAIAGARGDSNYLGFPLQTPFRTCILQGEIHLRGVFERAAQMLAPLAAGLTPEQSDRITLNTHRGLILSDSAVFQAFWEYVRAVRPDLVVLDPLAHVLTTSENDNAIVGAMLMRLALLRDDPGCSILLVHHDAKPTEATAGRSPQQRARGADRLNADPDSILSMRGTGRERGGPTSKLYVASRYGKTVEPFNVRLNEETLWFERYIERGDTIAIPLWVREMGGIVTEEAIVDRIEKEWELHDPRQHRAARNYLSAAVTSKEIVEMMVQGELGYALPQTAVEAAA